MKKVWIGLIALVLIVGLGWFFLSKQEKTEEKIKVVALLPQTGATSYIGNSIKNGLEVAEIKYGDKVKIIYTDTEGSSEKTISEKRRLQMLEKAKYYISVFSGTTKSLAPEFTGTDDLLFASCVSNANITLISDNLFRLFLNADGDARVMAQYAVDTLAKRNFAILYVNDDFGKDYCHAFEDEATKLGGNILYKGSFERGESDFRQILQQLKMHEKGCDGLYLLGYDNNFGIMLKQYAENKMSIPILSMATIGSPMVTNVIAPFIDKLPPIYFTNTLLDSKANQNEEKVEFIKLYEERFNDKPNYFAAFAYDIIVCIANADKDNMKQSLLKKDFHGVMGNIKFNKDRDAEFPVVIEKLN